MLNDIDLQEFGATDSATKKALKEYVVEEDDNNYNSEDE